MRRFLILLSLTVGPLACIDQTSPTGPNPLPPTLAVADAMHGFAPGFYWLPPLGKERALGGAFDPALAPEVEICELAGDDCRQVLATYTMTSGPRAEAVRLDGGHYAVNWNTRDFDLSADRRYRILVRAGRGVLLGSADVAPVETGNARKNVAASAAVPVVLGRTLPIKFRIETGIVGEVAVSPTRASVSPGATQQFVATLRDLHGNPVTGVVTWTSSSTQVATVSSTGLATPIAVGEATITATAGQVTGAASLEVTGLSVTPTVSAGFDHSCALAATGRAYCWGYGYAGQLGTGSTTVQPTPAAVVGGITFATLDAGDFHTCALTSAGRAYCWGERTFGKLGTGSSVDQLTPTPVVGDLTFASISAGPQHTCGVTTGGSAYCWGSGDDGQLGNNLATSQGTPTPVAGGLSFASISTGYLHTCGITTAGRAYCWGNPARGQLGTGVSGDGTPREKAPKAVATGLAFVAISASAYQTCALTAEGRAYCWGSGTAGRLGIGSTADQTTPAPVAGGLTFKSITTGYLHGCAIEAGTGRAYCWGDASYGQIGTGSTAGQLVPTPVAGGLTFASLSAGYYHTCGVTAGTGRRYCWGSNRSEQLGTGTPGNQLAPALVGPLP